MTCAHEWRFGLFTLGFAQLFACAEPPTPSVLVHEQVLTVQLQLGEPNKAVDILFVIDDSVSMAEEQVNLAANFGAFIEVLEAPDVEASYRVAVTTTDSGNPHCSADRSERGVLVDRPCTQRLDDFVVGELDVRDVACTDTCTLTDAELEVLPTTTAHDSIAKPRPWLENIDGKTNLAPGVAPADAFACFGPQGIAGCNFESPLESMYLALERVVDGQDPAYGFLRDEAITMIIFVTDGHDCSYAADGAEIFAPEGNRVFWSDPDATAPTAAVCWNAGVECVGDPSHYDSCDAVDRDIEGELTSSEDRAVLHPLERYIDRLQGIEDLRRELDPTPDRRVIVSLVAGVTDQGAVFHADADDPEVQDAYGIGPGCTGPNGIAAAPPVRLREFTEAFTPDNAFSICNPDYTPALQSIAEKIADQIRPACFPACVRDIDRATDIVEPDCYVEQRSPDRASEWVDECKRDADGYIIDPETMDYAMPADDVNFCYALLADDVGRTDDFTDDMSPECSELNYNLEFKLARRPGFPAPSGTSIYATCSLADHPQVDCPEIGEWH
jgi:hypothetical protein